MLADVGLCHQCGAQGNVGSQCEYCGSTITAPNIKAENNSTIKSWSDFQLDGYSLVEKNIDGYSDSSDFFVIEGIRSEKQGLINRSGKIVIPCIYDYVRYFIDYGICYVIKDNQVGVIGVDGKFIIPMSERGELEVFSPQFGMIVGKYTIYDLNGNLKLKLDSNQHILLFSSKFATTCESHKGLYNIESGEMILSNDYKIEKIIGENLFVVSKVISGFYRFGLYNANLKKFELNIDNLSIESLGQGRYLAKHKTDIEDSIKSVLKNIYFKISGDEIIIENEEEQTYHNAEYISGGNGCLLMLLLILFPLTIFLIL